jgi:hypothetical protein
MKPGKFVGLDRRTKIRCVGCQYRYSGYDEWVDATYQDCALGVFMPRDGLCKRSPQRKEATDETR